jgi:hypothetical protein
MASRGGKRGGGGGGGGGGKRKWAHQKGGRGGHSGGGGGGPQQKKARASADPAKGLQCLFITCDNKKERSAAQEVVNWATDFAAKMYPLDDDEPIRPAPTPTTTTTTEGSETKDGSTTIVKSATTTTTTATTIPTPLNIAKALDDELKVLRREAGAAGNGVDAGGDDNARFRVIDLDDMHGMALVHWFVPHAVQSRSFNQCVTTFALVVNSTDPRVNIVELCKAMLKDVRDNKALYTK